MSLFWVVIIILYLHSKSLTCLWCVSTVWSFAAKNLHHSEKATQLYCTSVYQNAYVLKYQYDEVNDNLIKLIRHLHKRPMTWILLYGVLVLNWKDDIILIHWLDMMLDCQWSVQVSASQENLKYVVSGKHGKYTSYSLGQILILAYFTIQQVSSKQSKKLSSPSHNPQTPSAYSKPTLKTLIQL